MTSITGPQYVVLGLYELQAADGPQQTTGYIAGQALNQSRTVQQYVKGEASNTGYGFSSVRPQADDLIEPEASVLTTEPLLTDKTDLAEDIQQGEVKPTPTAQQRRFSIDWDPIQ